MGSRKRARRPVRDGIVRTVYDLSLAHRLAPVAVAALGDEAGRARSADVRAVRSRWVVELAWDGHRVLGCTLGYDVRLISSDYREWTDVFPTIAAALTRLRRKDVVLEGWICALGHRGHPSFDLLRQHVRQQPQEVIFAVWDVHRIDGEDLRQRPLVERRARLVELMATSKDRALVVSEPLAGGIDALVEGIRAIGARGIVVRDVESTYPTEPSWMALADCPLEIDRQLSPPPKVTNQDKVLYPRDGITKLDVTRYYDDVAAVMLAYMKDRPIVGERWPDGIDEYNWYQHRMPPRAPDYLRAEWIDGNRRIVAENRDALVWLANQAILTFHGWPGRIGSLHQPDWVVIDLDPGEKTTWPQVIEVAIALRKLLELLELPSVPKTSGNKGLHVLVPIAPGHDVAQAHEIARRAAKMIAKVLPHLVSLESAREARGGKLYLDFQQNYVEKTLVLPYSLRATDGAPVSAPLEWSEVTPKLDPRTFTLRTMRQRLDARGDLAKPLLSGTSRLDEAIRKMEP